MKIRYCSLGTGTTNNKNQYLGKGSKMMTTPRPDHVCEDRLYDFDMFNVTGSDEPVDNLHETYARRLHSEAGHQRLPRT